MHRRLIPLLLLSAAAVVCLSGTSCSRQARGNRHLTAANRLYAEGRYDEAEIEYKNVLQLSGPNAAAIGHLGMMYLEQGRPGPAMPYLLKAKELQPDALDVRVKLGLALLTFGQRPGARDEALFVLEHRPTDVEAPMILADAARSAQELAAARARLTALPPAAQASAPVLVALGQLELRAGRTREAEALFQRARTADPKSPNAAAAVATLAWARKDIAAADAAFKAAADNSSPRSARRLQYAQFKIQSGDTAAASRLLEVITQQAPDYLPGWLWRAEIALGLRQYQEAGKFADAALARDSTHPETLLLRGRIHLAAGEPDKAIDVLERMVGLYGQAAPAHYELGLAYAAKGDRAKAREALSRAVALAPDSVPTVIALAEVQVRSGDFAGGVATLTPLVEKKTATAPALLLLAEAYRGLGNADAALAIYQQIETTYPDHAPTPFLRGLVLRQQNRRDAARAAFERALTLAPKSAATLEQLIDLDLLDTKFDSARRRAEAAVAANPSAAGPLLLLAKVCLAQHDHAGAEAALKRTIAAQPDAPHGYLALARLYMGSQQFPEAITNLKQLVARKPNDVEALTLLAVVYDQRKDAAAARETYERILAIAPKSTIALNNLAYLCADRLGDPEQAYAYAQRARALQPDDPRTADTLGWVQYQRGQYPQAVTLLQESASKLPDETEVQVHLGLAYYMLGDEAAARSTLEQAARKSPGNEAIQARLAVLATVPEHATAAERSRLEQAAAGRPADPIALSRLARCYEIDRNLPKARQTAEAALQVSPRNSTLLLQLARLCDAQGQRAQAIDYAKTARTLSTNNVAATHLLGRLVYTNGDYRWATSLLKEAADKAPEDPDVLFDCALAQYSVGQVTEAAAAAQRALRAQPDFARAAEARRFLDWVSIPEGPVDATLTARLQQTLQSEPDNVPALMAGGRLSEAAGNPKAAQSAYEKVLARFPDFAPAQKALTILYAANLEDATRAAAVAAKARQAYPADPAVAKALGIIVYRQRDYTRAATLLQESAGAKPGDSETLYYLGMSQYQLKKKAESKRSLQRALDLGLRPDLVTQARQTLAAAD